MKINCVEIFESIQGEGYNFGMKCVFVRLADCNFNCPWCDTNWKKTNISFNNVNELNNYLRKHFSGNKNIVLTGGEPTKDLELFDYLTTSLMNFGYNIYVETNGSNNIINREVFKNDKFDNKLWISTSPKIIYLPRYKKNTLIRYANEVRVVIDPNLSIESQLKALKYFKDNIIARYYYLSPCEVNGKFNFDKLAEIYDQVKNAGWKISIQLHKIMDVR